MSSVAAWQWAPDVDKRPVMVVALAEPPTGSGGPNAELRERWVRWSTQCHWQLLSRHRGHIVRQTSHHLWLEFADARHCLHAAFELNALAMQLNGTTAPDQGLRLRSAAHLARYLHGEREPVEQDRRLTAQLCALAAPGELLLTAELRDRLANGLDADLEDLGEWGGPSGEHLRLFRAQARSNGRAVPVASIAKDYRPSLVVIPFRPDNAQSSHWLIGELIAEGVITRLSLNIGWRVIARQSTTVLRDSARLGDIDRHLGSGYVLSGSLRVCQHELVVSAELADTRSHALLWQGQMRCDLNDLVQQDSELLHALASAAARALHKVNVNRALNRPLPSLNSSCLMLASISMGHSHSGRAFERGRDALTELCDRHPNLALPKAWLGLWHALNVIKCRSVGVRQDVQHAWELTQRALQTEPHNAMALAVQGYIQCLLLGQPDEARLSLTAAIEANPSEPMTWLFKSLHSAAWDTGGWAVAEAVFAQVLSPIDPLQYFFDLLTANALLADRQLENAVAYGRRSLRAHKGHVPTLRLLLTAQAELGRLDEAKETLDQLRAKAPTLTVSSYLATGSADSPMRQRMANAMRRLGLPES
jgi:adenylate cyclase